jgi:chemotaxis protein MotB
MARKRGGGERENHERWLVSYADFITLLFAFFVVLYASSQIDRNKMNALSDAIHQAFQRFGVLAEANPGKPLGAGPGAGPVQKIGLDGTAADALLRKQLEDILGPEIRNRSVAIRHERDGLVISFREMAFFDSGSAAMRGTGLQTLDRIVALLRQYNLRIEGHTDNVPIRNSLFPSNWELSTARATGIIQELITHHDFPPEQLSAAGYAEFHPTADNATDEGRRLNRRIDIVILQPAPPAEQ